MPHSPADQPVFAAVIQPNRSLGRQAQRLVITLVAAAGIVSSIPFMIAGAWPVAGYFGLDVLLLAIAFRVNTRRARACEEVRVTPLEICLRKICHRGRAEEWRFNPAWTRLERRDHAEFGLQGLALVCGRQTVDVAAALSPAERRTFADGLEAGLVRARRGADYRPAAL
jgi:uncharacterized membrane protein